MDQLWYPELLVTTLGAQLSTQNRMVISQVTSNPRGWNPFRPFSYQISNDCKFCSRPGNVAQRSLDEFCLRAPIRIAVGAIPTARC